MCWSFYLAFHDLGGKPVGALLAREWEGGGVLLGQVLYILTVGFLSGIFSPDRDDF